MPKYIILNDLFSQFRLYCKCAELAELKGYSHFGLQFYGECWSGPSAASRFAMQGSSDRCIGPDFKACDDSAVTECIGKDATNYIYQLVKEESKSLLMTCIQDVVV